MERDVLDTWFSSGLWPFSVLGWPQQTADLQRYYPTQIMETGHDILFFWVARMIMMGIWFTDKPPFHTVYLHGLVRDKNGRKFSKTLGNVIDPLTIVDQYGADPLRFALITSGAPGNDVSLDETRIDHAFRFINKIWQITSFVNQNLDGELELGLPPSEELDLPSRWIVSRLHRLTANVQYLFDIYQYGEAGSQILAFIWDELAPCYLEISKHAMYEGDETDKIRTRRTLVHALDTCLRLLHPFMPFMTEEAWRYIPHDGEALIIAPWPQADPRLIDDDIEARMNVWLDVARGIRHARSEYKVDPGRRIKAVMRDTAQARELFHCAYVLKRLCHVDQLELMAADAAEPENAAAIVAGDITLYLPLEGMMDIEAECRRLQKEHARLTQQLDQTAKRLNNPRFISRARPDIVQRQRTRQIDIQAARARIEDRLTKLCP